MGFFSGSKNKFKQFSRLGDDQLPLKQQLLNSALGKGGSGAFGSASKYYQDLLSDDSSTFDAFAAPEMRQFREQIIPDLAEQFAGMGSGNLSSSGFRNASISAGTDLSERLAAIRAGLRQQGAAGLMNLGQQGLQSFYDNVYMPGQEGFLGQISPLVGTGLGIWGGMGFPGIGQKKDPYGGISTATGRVV